MLELLKKFFHILLAVYVFTLAYQWWKPTPDVVLSGVPLHGVPEQDVHFLADTTFLDKDGKRTTDQHIWGEMERTIKSATHSILLDAHLFNDFQGESPEKTRTLSHDLSQALTAKKEEDKHIAIAVITDPVNILYGGVVSPYFEKMREEGILVTLADLRELPDSNLFYSAFWRPFFSWTGNSTQGGWLTHPYQYGGSKVTLRSWLALLNLKADHQDLLVADQPIIKKGKQSGQKMATIVTSLDPHDAGSADGNVLLKVDDQIWQDVFQNERRIAQFSDSGLPTYKIGDVNDESGSIKVGLYKDLLIKYKVLDLVERSKLGDHLDLVAHHLSERDVMQALVDAENRGVHVRMILDPNQSGYVSGIPNQAVAKEMIRRSNNGIQIRWCDTHGEECHANLLLGSTATSSFMMLGSADLTRRGVGGYDLNTDVFAEGSGQFAAWKDANTYFEKMWTNKNATYTTDYENNVDDTFWKNSLYRILEMTGTGTF